VGSAQLRPRHARERPPPGRGVEGDGPPPTRAAAGVGRALMLALEGHARRLGRTTLILDTPARATRRRRLYRGLGWTLRRRDPRLRPERHRRARRDRRTTTSSSTPPPDAARGVAGPEPVTSPCGLAPPRVECGGDPARGRLQGLRRPGSLPGRHVAAQRPRAHRTRRAERRRQDDALPNPRGPGSARHRSRQPSPARRRSATCRRRRRARPAARSWGEALSGFPEVWELERQLEALAARLHESADERAHRPVRRPPAPLRGARRLPSRDGGAGSS
jgi:hypothetical protein